MKNNQREVAVDGESLRSWLESMRTANAWIEREKSQWLSAMTPQESLQIYLDLWQTALPYFDLQRPSEYLIRIQRVYQRMLEARERDNSTRSCD